MNPFFTIIIPTYNRAHLLPVAIKSVLDQSFSDWEVIVVDDGSTDHTEETVRQFTDPRIRYFWQENKELNGARNTGVRLAEGSYIGFLDDDDELLHNHLMDHYKCIKSHDDKVAIFKSGLTIKEKEGNTKQIRWFDAKKESSIEYIFEVQQGIHTFSFHREIFSSIMFDETYKLFDDDHFTIRAYLKYPLIQIPSYTVIYKKHEDNRTELYTQQEKYFNNYIQGLDSIIAEYETALLKHISMKKIKLLKSRIFLSQAIKMLRLNKISKARAYFKSALSYSCSIKNWKYYILFIKAFILRPKR